MEPRYGPRRFHPVAQRRVAMIDKIGTALFALLLALAMGFETLFPV